MSNFRCVRRGLFATVLGLGLAPFQAAWAQVTPGTIVDGDSIFIDGQTFKIAPGQAKPDAAATIRNLGGRELGPGVIIYRSGDQLYILGAPLTLEPGRRGTPGGRAVDADREQLGRIRIEYDAPKIPSTRISMSAYGGTRCSRRYSRSSARFDFRTLGC